MSLDTIAAFLHRAAHDAQLRRELAAVAGRYGFLVSPDELSDLDLAALSAAFEQARAAPQPPPEMEDEEPSDPGFGIIEVPA